MKLPLVLIAALLPALAAQAQTPNPCIDPAGYARHLVASNPGANTAVLAQAFALAQQSYGCRAPAPPAPAVSYPSTTRCAWEGYGPSRAWVCRAD